MSSSHSKKSIHDSSSIKKVTSTLEESSGLKYPIKHTAIGPASKSAPKSVKSVPLLTYPKPHYGSSITYSSKLIMGGGYDVPSIESDKHNVKHKYNGLNKDNALEKLTMNHYLTTGELDMLSNYESSKIAVSEPKNHFKTQQETNELLALISTQLTDLQLRMTVIENKLSKIENYAITDIEI
jgi:hypothetical protein